MLETIQSYTSQYPEILWMVLGGVFFVMEVAVITGVGFLFAGFGALTLGGLMAFKVIPENFSVYTDLYAQIAFFFAMVTLWVIILWIPLKKMQKRGSAARVKNFIGTTAFVGGDKLIKGKMGTVKWSGANMRARISEDAATETIDAFAEVDVVDMRGQILIVSSTGDNPEEKQDDNTKNSYPPKI